EEVERCERLNFPRDLAVAQHWLGTVYLKALDYGRALMEFSKARDGFAAIGEPVSVGQAWHMIGATLWYMNRLDEAEDAFKYALSINVRQKNSEEEARNLLQLAHLYGAMGRNSQAADLYGEAIARTRETGNLAAEGRAHGGLAGTFMRLRRYGESRQE